MIFEQLAFTIVGLLFLSVLVSLAYQRSLLTTSVIFLSVWSVVMLGKYYQNGFDGYDRASSVSYELLTKGIVGMACGCLSMQVFLGRPRFSADHLAAQYANLPSYLSGVFRLIFWTTFLFGMLAFFVDGAGFGFSFSQLGDIRKEAISEGGSFATRLARYTMNIAFVGAILLALSDFTLGKVSINRLVLLCIAVLPLSLSKGSRIEFVQIALLYFSAAFLLASLNSKSNLARLASKAYVRRVVSRGLLLMLALGIVFSAMGLARSAGNSLYADVQGAIDSFVYPITSYFSGSIYSVGPISDWIETTLGPSFGTRNFEFLYKLLEPFGFENVDNKSIVRSAYDQIGSIAISPGSFVRYIVSDFGSTALPYVSFCIGAFITFVVLRINLLSLVTFSFAALMINELVYSFQAIGIFSTGNFYTLLVASFFAYFFNRHRRQYSAQEGSMPSQSGKY